MTTSLMRKNGRGMSATEPAEAKVENAMPVVPDIAVVTITFL